MSKTKTNLGLVEYCQKQLGKPYWYGTFGQTSTAYLYLQKKKQYPSFYTADNFNKQIGQRVHDCIGLIKGYLWSDTPTSRPTYNESQDVDVSGMLSKCTKRGMIGSIPEVPGLLVFKTGHVGVYIGNGEVIEAKGHAYGVIKTKLVEGNWQDWGECPWITYVSSSGSGSDSKPIKTEECKVTIVYNVLKKGSNGEQVKTVQRLLKSLGIAGNGKSLVIDGIYGVNTEAAVKAFQIKNTLTSDGIVGVKTWSKLTGGQAG